MSTHDSSHRDVPTAREIRNSHGGAHQRNDVSALGAQSPVQLGVDANPDGGGFDSSLAELTTMRTQLVQELGQLPGLLSHAAQLQHTLTDGHGPISHAMRKLFRDRAGDEEGVTVALAQYQGELTNLIAALDQTIAHYQVADESAQTALPQEPQNV